ncbi:hypothetical protein HNO88_000627 [Novosphingobium chloroacetimidivorans]|uniref:EF-hand domain-containing protein n=1 Tax=Novosphingobium chloroacetimidivorans TaxID=1428314 RepID=A0A7W7K6U1_9SPHN|nr:EF-hand domain-containing protein [Novosphingobium chloroacetimidivorans]MBB4857320.1 hypothetical protein [Novosphingobium chloroacetimidivorans]
MTIKTIAIGLSAAALALAGGAANAAQTQGARWGDADGNGVLTRAEAQTQAATRFAKLDQNKDGKLDKADRQLAREARKTRMFERLDANKDGQITKAEFTADRGPAKAGPRMAADGPDGAKSWGKGRGGHRWGGRGGHRGGMMMGKMADANGDGAVTQAEFAAATLKRFDTIDANKDGQVTQAERQAAREQMKAKWQQMRAQKAQG